ncbi:MAG: sigma-70 family RNA polymerase sigma factor [Pirellulales bacterium]|nr:sigma-70 family RNA polymerase sigma factor [Pirellulales bacterium]
MADELEPLVVKIRGGDVAALAEYLTARRPQLTGFIIKHLGPALRSKVEPDDIFQETSIEAVRALPQSPLGDRDIFGWLCQIAERKMIDAHRRYFDAQKRSAAREVPLGAGGAADDSQRVALIDMLVASMTSPSAAFSRDVRNVQLLEALAKLPEEQREALRLRYVEGLPSKQIAERLRKSDGAIRVMLTRSLAKLQQLLGPRQPPRS